jgi:hypothetical protein
MGCHVHRQKRQGVVYIFIDKLYDRDGNWTPIQRDYSLIHVSLPASLVPCELNSE